jgi:hypothetical protein
MPHSVVPEPWNSFLRDLDRILNQPADFHCIGGFVITNFYGSKRETRDVDVLEVRSSGNTEQLFELGREGSVLHKKHHIYLDRVTVVEAPPEDYEARLTEMYAGAFTNIRLFAPEAHDLALMKLHRNIERDREDIKHLARNGHITVNQLRNRYEKEMRPYIALPEKRTDPILHFWIDMIREVQEL